MTALYIYAALTLLPFLVLAPTAVHAIDSDWLERELERRIEEEDGEEPASNDNWRLA